MDLVRAPGAPPAPALPGMGDHPTAVSMYAGIVTALLRRQKTGEGSYVHTSLLANGIWSASCIAQASFADAEFERYRGMLGHLFTRVMYETKDHRWLQFTMVRAEEELDVMFALLGMPEVRLDPRFADPVDRLQNGDQLVELIRPAVASRTSDEWMADFSAAGVPVALVGEVERLPNDVQVQSNDILREGSDTGLSRVIKHPVNVKDLPEKAVSRAPEMGEHTHQVLSELDYSDAQIQKIVEQGAV